MNFLASLLNLVSLLIILLVIVKVILSYYLSPFHPVRQFVDGLIEPLLAPIRRAIPPVGIFDISPLILIILVQVVISLIIKILSILLSF